MHTEPLSSDKFPFEHTYLTLDETGLRMCVGDPDQEYRFASVTKPMAAWAVLVAVEQGKVSLDDAAGPEGSTVAHLLSHASGLLPDPGDPIAQPGRSRIYSNFGFDTLGEFVAGRVGMPIQQWVREAVFEPLSMQTAHLEGSIAKDAGGTADDVAKFAAELLTPTLISRQLYERAITPVFPGISGVVPGYGRQKDNQWGLGVEIRDHKSPHWLGSDFSPETFGHYGRSGSFVYVDPTVHKAGVFLGAQDWGEIHADLWPDLTNQMRAI